MARFFNILFYMKLPFNRIKYLSNNQLWHMGFIPHLGFIYPTKLRFVGYNHFDLKDLLAQKVIRFVSSALKIFHKIRTERLHEVGVPWLMRFS